MEQYKILLDDILNDILNEVRSTNDESVYKKIKECILIKSVNDETFSLMMDYVLKKNPNILFTVIGDFFNEEIKLRYKNNIKKIILNNDKLCGELAEKVLPKLEYQGFDSIVFLNYSVHRESYINVEEFVARVNDDIRVHTYVFVIDDGCLYEHLDIRKHYLSLSAYTNLLKYLDYSPQEEKD